MKVHDGNAYQFHEDWEVRGLVLIKAVTGCPEHTLHSCYWATDDPLEAADWITSDPDGSFYLKGPWALDRGTTDDDSGWTKMTPLRWVSEVDQLRWVPSITAGMEIAACWNWKYETP